MSKTPTMAGDDLLRRGFERYAARPLSAHNSIALYQYTVRAPDGTRLFSINVDEMRLPDAMPPASRDVYRWAIRARLYRDGLTMELNLHHEPGMTPGDIVGFYLAAHEALGCTRDPHND